MQQCEEAQAAVGAPTFRLQVREACELLVQTFAMVNDPKLNYQLVSYQTNSDRILIAQLLQRGLCYPRRHRDISGKLHWRRGAGVTWEMNELVCDGLRTSILGRIQMCAPEVFERYGDDMADGYSRIHHESEERAGCWPPTAMKSRSRAVGLPGQAPALEQDALRP
eukprot:COSAG04_NODE_158_length_22122_cov_49.992326_16_plen_166_part_00